MKISSVSSWLCQVRIAGTEAQQLALLGNASALADELLPRAAAKLVPGGVHLMVGRDDIRSGIRRGNTDRSQFATVATRLPELKDWRRRLQRGVDRLRDHFCRQCVLELIYYSDDAESQLSPEMYLNLDYEGADVAAWQQEPMPSAIFQVHFPAWFKFWFHIYLPRLIYFPVTNRSMLHGRHCSTS